MSPKSRAPQPWGHNPFPISAVARLSPAGSETISITTRAIEDVVRYVDQYLAASSTQRPARSGKRSGGAKKNSGNVIAVVGEYGTGKTHLAVEILHRIHAASDETVHAFYVDAPSDNFLTLYRERFFRQLDRADVLRRVTEYYADIVAEDLSDSPLTRELATRLKDRRLSPDQLIHGLGLTEAAFRQQLQSRLKEITRHADFGTALALAIRPEFQSAVWEWLGGHPADSALRERGITTTIDNDIAALEAIGVFAFLYGRQHHRFVLVIDEFEKVLSRGRPSARDEASVLAFKKLLEVFTQSRSLLVLSGLPDFLEFLPEDAQQRFATLVRPTALSFADTKAYIQHVLASAEGDGPDGDPFGDDVTHYLVELAGGNARKIIRLCYHVYQASLATGNPITRAMVREVAREQFEISAPDDVRADVARVFDGNGWDYARNRKLGDDEASLVDFWLQVGKSTSGCAVLISQSVLHKADVEALLLRREAIRAATKQSSFCVLVVNGYLAGGLAAAVDEGFDRVHTYSQRRFPEDFAATITGFVQRLEAASAEDRLGRIENRIDRLLRQTGSLRSEINIVQHNQTSSVEVEQTVLRAVRGALGERTAYGAPPPADTDLPVTVVLRIDGLLGRLGALRRYSDTLLAAAFRSGDGERGARPVSRGLRESRYSFDDMYDYARMTAPLRQFAEAERIVRVFRDALNDAQAALRHDAERDIERPSLVSAMDQVRDLCRTYDRMIEETFRDSAHISEPFFPSSRLGRPGRAIDTEEIESTYNDVRRLGERVYNAFHGGGDEVLI